MRQMPNLRYTARGRPHSMQRRTVRVENFGGRFAAAIFDLLAMVRSNACLCPVFCLCLFFRLCLAPRLRARLHRYAAASPSFLSGSPIATKNSRASSSVSAEVTNVMFMP